MNFSKMNDFLESMPRRGIPACDLVIAHHGKTVYRKQVGLANADVQRPVDDSTLWWVYSISKISTCCGALQLIEQGKLSLEDPVSRYLPSFETLTVQGESGLEPCRVPMTIRHLFTMTSGIGRDSDHPCMVGSHSGNRSTAEVISELGKEPLLFQPGTQYHYGLSHDILGAVISVIAGMSLEAYLKENLWLPLGMTDTGFEPTEEQKNRLSDMYHTLRGTCTAELLPRPLAARENGNYHSGGGGVFSSAGDMIRLMTALSLGGISPEGVRILKQETVEQMEQDRIPPEVRRGMWQHNRYGYSWGLCGRVHVDPDWSLSPSSVGEFGWNGAAGSFALIDRKQEIAIFFATAVRGCKYVYNLIMPHLRDLTYEGLNA